jgi:hypothetical protein
MKMRLRRTEKRPTSLMRQKFVLTHTFRQTETQALLAAGLQTHLLSKCLVHKKLLLLIAYFRKTKIYLNVGLLMVCLVVWSLVEMCMVG